MVLPGSSGILDSVRKFCIYTQKCSRMDEKQSFLIQLSAAVPQTWSCKIQCKLPQGWEVGWHSIVCPLLALTINLWQFIPVSVSFYPFMDIHKQIPFQECRSWWITERKKHTGTFQREGIMPAHSSWEKLRGGCSGFQLRDAQAEMSL